MHMHAHATCTQEGWLYTDTYRGTCSRVAVWMHTDPGTHTRVTAWARSYCGMADGHTVALRILFTLDTAGRHRASLTRLRRHGQALWRALADLEPPRSHNCAASAAMHACTSANCHRVESGGGGGGGGGGKAGVPSACALSCDGGVACAGVACAGGVACDDIDCELRFFSYAHFYVIFTTFSELDADGDLELSPTELQARARARARARHASAPLPNTSADRPRSAASMRPPSTPSTCQPPPPYPPMPTIESPILALTPRLLPAPPAAHTTPPLPPLLPPPPPPLSPFYRRFYRTRRPTTMGRSVPVWCIGCLS